MSTNRITINKRAFRPEFEPYEAIEAAKWLLKLAEVSLRAVAMDPANQGQDLYHHSGVFEEIGALAAINLALNNVDGV